MFVWLVTDCFESIETCLDQLMEVSANWTNAALQMHRLVKKCAVCAEVCWVVRDCDNQSEDV